MIVVYMAEQVMNNVDLRRIIFSYFRKKPEVTCCSCKKVCVWDKKIIRRYTTIPTMDYSKLYHQCLECHWTSQTREFFI